VLNTRICRIETTNKDRTATQLLDLKKFAKHNHIN